MEKYSNIGHIQYKMRHIIKYHAYNNILKKIRIIKPKEKEKRMAKNCIQHLAKQMKNDEEN